MKEKFLRISCDSCGKTIEINNDNENAYPFDKGWHRLNSLSAVISKKKSHKLQVDSEQININDSHFCSSKCLKSFISKVIDKTEKIQTPVSVSENDFEEQGKGRLF